MEHIWLLILSALGFLISYYIWYKHNFKKEKLVCMIGNDCEKVINSKYGRVFGVDNTILGMLYYSFIFFIGILQFFIPVFLALNLIVLGKIIISGASALFSVYLTFIQLGILKEICEYCLVASLINLIIFVVVLI